MRSCDGQTGQVRGMGRRANVWISRLKDAVTGVEVSKLEGNEVHGRSELYTVINR